MKIIAAEHRGFCYGVKRAVAMAEECIGKPGEIHTLGPIIHNPQMVKRLSDKGIDVANDLSQVSDESTVIIRSHGVGPEVYHEAEAKKIHIIDATCPHVKKAQQAARQLLEDGYTVVVVGERHHPEVKSIVEWSDQTALVIETVDEARELPTARKLGVVAQTTFVSDVFQAIIAILKDKCDELKVSRTICTATDLRQQAALELASTVDIMIVVGGKNSGNTTRLMQICRDAGSRVYHIETAQELELKDFQGVLTVGLTAGASTPDWIIEEVYKKMEEFDKMINGGIKKLEQDSIIQGTVVGVRQTEVFVDIGYKAEGIISLEELAYPVPEKAADVVSNGYIIDVYVLDAETHDGVIQLSKVKADQILAWDKLEKALSEKRAVEGKVVEVVKGGLKVAVFGIQGFVPASMVELRFTEDLSPFVDQTFMLVPIEVDRTTKRIVLSRKALLEAERRRQEEEVFSTLAIGQVLTGTVGRIVDFGAFVDIGYKAEGIISLEELAYPVPEKADDIVSNGDIIAIYVLDAETHDGVIKLSKVKADQILAWDKLEKALSEKQAVEGKVLEVVKGGLKVAVFGIQGFVPASMVELRFTEDLSPFVDQTFMLVPIEVDRTTKRVVLSRKVLLEAERRRQEEEIFSTLAIGQVLTGTVGRIVDFGAFVDIGGIDGLVHISDLSWHRVKTPHEVVSIGDEVKVVILKIDPNEKRISLSLKQVGRDPWLDVVEQFSNNMIVTVTINKITTFGAFAELVPGVEGLIHISEMSEQKIHKVEDAVTVGQQVAVKIIDINKGNKRISLSISQAQQEVERAEFSDYLSTQESTGTGLTIGDKFAHLFKR